MNNSPKTIWRRYFFHGIFLELLLCALIAVLLYFYPHPVLIVCGILFWTVSLLIIAPCFYRKHIISVLHTDLDPQKYLAILEYGKQKFPDALALIDAAYFAGDHQTVVDLCTKNLQDPKLKNQHLYYMLALARVYFHCGLYDETRELCQRMEDELAASKNEQFLRKQYRYLTFLKCYIDQDYEGCKAYVDSLPPPKTNLIRICATFNRALIHFKTGDLASAKEQFAEVAAKAPKLYLATVSNRYLQAIEAGNEKILRDPPPTPNPSFTYQPQRSRKKSRIKLLICLLLLILLTLWQFSK